MDPMNWHGSWPVMLTAFDADLAIDWYGVDALTDWYLDSGSTGLFSACLSSEATLLSADEITSLVTRVVRRTAARVPVAAGVMGAAGFDERVELAKRLGDAGADVVILVSNDFAAAGENDAILVERLADFAERVPGVRLGLYECPVPYKRLIEPAHLAAIARTGRFFWLKETSCEADTIVQKIIACEGTPLKIFNANFELMLEAIRAGAAGFSGIIANFFPAQVAELCNAASFDDADVQATFRLLMAIDRDLDERFYATAYPPIAKLCAARQGVPIGTHTRVPQRLLPTDAEAAVDRYLERLLSPRAAFARTVLS